VQLIFLQSVFRCSVGSERSATDGVVAVTVGIGVGAIGVAGSPGVGTMAGYSGSVGVPGSGTAGVIGTSGTAGVAGSSGCGTSAFAECIAGDARGRHLAM
jgi:hypothetical protein